MLACLLMVKWSLWSVPPRAFAALWVVLRTLQIQRMSEMRKGTTPASLACDLSLENRGQGCSVRPQDTAQWSSLGGALVILLHLII